MYKQYRDKRQTRELIDGHQIRNRWKEYIAELYDKENAPTMEDMSNKTQQASNWAQVYSKAKFAKR